MRALAYAADVLMLMVAVAALQAILYRVNPLVRDGRPPSGRRLHCWVFVTVSIPILLYFVISYESSWQAVLRAAVLLIPFELNHVVMFYPKPIQSEQAPAFRYGFVIVLLLMMVYLAAVPLTQYRQSIHDLVARTLVLRS